MSLNRPGPIRSGAPDSFIRRRNGEEDITYDHPILEDINFKIVDRPTKSGQRFRGITINSMDTKNISMIVARLKADEIFPRENFTETSFCVKSAMFSSLIQTIKPGCCLEMKRQKNKSNLDICGRNPNRATHETNLHIPTMDVQEEVNRLDIIDYKYIVDIDLGVMRGITRVAQNATIGAETIRFKIYEGVNERNDTKITKVSVSLDSDKDDPSMEQVFRSVTKWDRNDQNQTVITTSESMDDKSEQMYDDLKEVINQKFSTKYLHLFLKAMDRQTITLRMSPNKPLVIMYPLGDGESIGYCNFILAPTD